MTPCLVRLPKPLMHDVVIALRSDSLPHTHMWGSQRLVPRRKPTATLTASLSNFSPHEAIGMDKSQSPACGAVTALQLAWSDALGNESAISSMTRFWSGLSYALLRAVWQLRWFSVRRDYPLGLEIFQVVIGLYDFRPE